MSAIKPLLTTLATAFAIVSAFMMSLVFLFFALPLLLLAGAARAWHMRRQRASRPVIIEHVSKP